MSVQCHTSTVALQHPTNQISSAALLILEVDIICQYACGLLCKPGTDGVIGRPNPQHN